MTNLSTLPSLPIQMPFHMRDRPETPRGNTIQSLNQAPLEYNAF